MKLGKKLEVSGDKEIIKLLVDGAVFYSQYGCDLVFRNNQVMYNTHFVASSTLDISDYDWYYPAKTYTINGVELVDERLSYEEAIKSKWVYFSSTMSVPLYENCHQPDMKSKEYMQQLCDFNLVHSTQKAAILHTQSMIQVAK